MASTRQLKGRIRSVSSSKQITKAMELVAASKLRRAQEATKRSQAYADAASELLTQLSVLTDVKRNMFFAERPVKRRLIILITSDSGFAGAYNSNVSKKFVEIVKADKAAGIATSALTIGRKGTQFVSKIKDVDAFGAYHDLPDQATAVDIRPILISAVNAFEDEQIDAVTVVMTRFVNGFTQVAESFQLLPAGFKETEVSSDVALSTFEPTVEEVLDGAVVRLLEAQLYQALLSSVASEQSMRRIAMKNATDNANDLVDDLTLEMNKVRQAAITQELSEISGGVEALK